jgi:hypothetical protein
MHKTATTCRNQQKHATICTKQQQHAGTSNNMQEPAGNRQKSATCRKLAEISNNMQGIVTPSNTTSQASNITGTSTVILTPVTLTLKRAYIPS